MDSIGTRRPVIPLLVHEDCMGDIKTDLAGQQASLTNIGEKITSIDYNVSDIETNTNSIKTSSSNTATQLAIIKEDTDTLASNVGRTTDTSSANTVIGLLKSISNKITTF